MLWESVITFLLVFVVFGFVGDLKGKLWAYVRVGLGTVAAVAAFSASGEFFDHPGWAGALEGQTVSGRASIVFFAGYLLGPVVLGWVFLLVSIMSAATARKEWISVAGVEPGRCEQRVYSVLAGIFNPIRTVRVLWGSIQRLLAVPGVAVVLAALIVAAGLWQVASKL